MPTCPPNLRYPFFTVYKIITFKIEEKINFNCKILYLAYMPTCPPNLRYPFFTVYKIITFRIEEFYFFHYILYLRGTTVFWNPKKLFFGVHME
jgi:hypothetical protein